MFWKKSDTTVQYPEIRTGELADGWHEEEASPKSQTREEVDDLDLNDQPEDMSLGYEGDGLNEGCERCSDPRAQWLEFMTVASFLFFTQHKRFSHSLCASCAKKQGLSALTSSATLGWWGMPWGLLTLQAIWINTKSLFHGSSLPKPFVAVASLASLTVPIALVVVILGNDSAPGDLISQTSFDLMQKGHKEYSQNNMEEAVAFYAEASRTEPMSGMLKMYLAAARANQGDLEEALTAAIAADQLTEGRSDAIALRGWILLHMGNEREARGQYARIRGEELIDDYDPEWLEALPMEFGDWEELMRVTAWAKEKTGPDPFYQGTELLSLVGLNRMAEARTIAEGLDQQTKEHYLVAEALLNLKMHETPTQGALDLTENWDRYNFSDRAIKALAETAENSEDLEGVKTVIRDWLFDPETPTHVWWGASHWFKEQNEWRETLELFNNQRIEIAPIEREIQLLHPILDRQRLAKLGRRVRTIDHPLAASLGAYGLGAAQYEIPRSQWLSAIDEFLEIHPNLVSVQLGRANVLATMDLKRALQFLSLLEQQEHITPEDKNDIHISRARFLLYSGQMDDAETLAKAVDRELLPSYFDEDELNLLLVEVALTKGDLEEAEHYLEPLEAQRGAPASALILGWVADLLADRAPTCEKDTKSWLRLQNDEITDSRSSLTQALLLGRGKVTREWALRATGNHYPSTFQLVKALQQACSPEGQVDQQALRQIAADRHPHDYAPRIAQILIQQ